MDGGTHLRYHGAMSQSFQSVRPVKTRGLLLIAAAAMILPLTGPPAARAADAGAPKLSLPVDCRIGETCFIQQYVDVDPSSGAQDYRCGVAAYDGHQGIDIRVLSTRVPETRATAVIAAADGIVRGVRDGMSDGLRGRDDNSIAGRECGNGVVIDHDGGLQTQYCHLKEGSVRVRRGDRVTRGQRLGDVGYSGLAQFAHVHMTVRRAGVVVDPFLGRPAALGCNTKDGASAASTMWTQEAAAALVYREGELIEVGFAAGPVSPRDAETGAVVPVDRSSAALVVYARAINLQAGDRLALRLAGPGGIAVETPGEAVGSKKAHFVGFAGKRLTAPRWPAGTYRGEAQVVRAGRIVARRAAEMILR